MKGIFLELEFLLEDLKLRFLKDFQFMLLTHLVMIFYCLPVIPLSPSVCYMGVSISHVICRLGD